MNRYAGFILLVMIALLAFSAESHSHSNASDDIETNTSEINLSVRSLAGESIMASLSGDSTYANNQRVPRKDAERFDRHTSQHSDVRALFDDVARAELYALILQSGRDPF